jgi:metal-dependent amidase/aminoacylase/carboxypeptidase family protein
VCPSYISNAPGVRMSGVDMFDVTFYGIGGHGSAPHLAKDPVIMAASAILDYQSIASRQVSAQSPHVITVGSVLAGSANNIIPESATLKVGIRWFSEADRQTMRLGINKVDSGIALANNLPLKLYPTVTERGFGYPVKNDTAMTAKINTTLGQLMPHDHNLTDRPAWMASEDFPFLIGNKKNAVYDYMFVGVANPAWFERALAAGKEYPFFNHNPNFEIDLAAIPFGVAVGATSVLELFRK